MNQLFGSHVNDVLEYKRRYCDEIVPVPELNAVQSLCKLLGVFATPQNGVELGEDRDAYSVICKMWFFFWYVRALTRTYMHAHLDLANFETRQSPNLPNPPGWLVGDGLIRKEANSRAPDRNRDSNTSRHLEALPSNANTVVPSLSSGSQVVLNYKFRANDMLMAGRERETTTFGVATLQHDMVTVRRGHRGGSSEDG